MKNFDGNWQNLQKTFAIEVGKDLAEKFIAALFKASNGDYKKAAKIYTQIGISWAPLIIHWRDWIIKNSSSSPMLVMRDAKPLTALPISDLWPRIWLNRSICGIKDEISGENPKMDDFLRLYLEQKNLNTSFTFVDSGCWGTIVKELHDFGLSFQPLFFFSHNPFIPGFLNQLGIDKKDGEILNDSFEFCFPNIVARPSSMIKTGDIVIPKLEETDKLSMILGKAALAGIKIGAENNKIIDPREASDRLLELSMQARKGKFTGILPYNSPTWSEGDDFLSKWDKKLSWT